MESAPISASIYIGTTLAGHLTHYQDGRNVFVLDNDYLLSLSQQPTLSLSFSEAKPIYSTMHALPTFFSNLLPEGYLREYVCNNLGLKSNNEFALLLALKNDLPGNIFIEIDECYQHSDSMHKSCASELATTKQHQQVSQLLNFSLAGIQIKFSMLSQDHQFTLFGDHIGDYIVKTPSVIYPKLPENEFAMMQLAALVGIDIPKNKLVKLEQLKNLPTLNLPSEQFAYAVKRFDRQEGNRIHIEDFTQALGVYGHEKYTATNYESLIRLLLATSENSADDVAELIRRITFNILIANTDAHLKNFSLIYPDKIKPRLAPAYDLITSLGYINNTELALNFARKKNFYEIDHTVVTKFVKRASLESNIVVNTIEEVIQLANKFWPTAIKNLPIPTLQLNLLRQHWKALQKPFKIFA